MFSANFGKIWGFHHKDEILPDKLKVVLFLIKTLFFVEQGHLL